MDLSLNETETQNENGQKLGEGKRMENEAGNAKNINGVYKENKDAEESNNNSDNSNNELKVEDVGNVEKNKRRLVDDGTIEE